MSDHNTNKCPHCGKDAPQKIWRIPAPDSIRWVQCKSFREAYFKGYDIPRLWTDGISEDFEVSRDRVSNYWKML